VVRAVVVLVLERILVVGGEVVAATTTRALAGRGRDLDQISVAINQETGPAEVRCQSEGAVEPLVNMPLASEGCQQRMSSVRCAVGDEVRNDVLKSSLVFIISR
jgi:hypothetical protein